MGTAASHPLRLVVLLLLLFSAGCASQTAGTGEGLSPPQHGIEDVPVETRELFAVSDPMEPMNRLREAPSKIGTPRP